MSGTLSMLHKAITMQIFAFLKWPTWSKLYFTSHKFANAVAWIWIMWAPKMKINYCCLCTLLIYIWHYVSGEKNTQTMTKRDLLSHNRNGLTSLIIIIWRNIAILVKQKKQIVFFHSYSKREVAVIIIDDSPHCWAVTQQDTSHWWRREKANRGVCFFLALWCLTHL